MLTAQQIKFFANSNDSHGYSKASLTNTASVLGDAEPDYQDSDGMPAPSDEPAVQA